MTDYPSTEIGGSLTVDEAGSEDVTNWFSEISSGNVYASTLVNLSASMLLQIPDLTKESEILFSMVSSRTSGL